MKQVKVPKEVMDVFYESAACRAISEQYLARTWFISPKAIYYRARSEKARAVGWRGLQAVHPTVKDGVWELDIFTGVATKEEPIGAAPIPKVKKPRKPKVVVPTTTEGEVK